MSRELLLLVDALAREKNVHKEVVFGALELALASATKKRFKDDVRDVREGYECGMALANYQDIQKGDVIECFEMEQVEAKL